MQQLSLDFEFENAASTSTNKSRNSKSLFVCKHEKTLRHTTCYYAVYELFRRDVTMRRALNLVRFNSSDDEANRYFAWRVST